MAVTLTVPSNYGALHYAIRHCLVPVQVRANMCDHGINAEEGLSRNQEGAGLDGVHHHRSCSFGLSSFNYELTRVTCDKVMKW